MMSFKEDNSKIRQIYELCKNSQVSPFSLPGLKTFTASSINVYETSLQFTLSAFLILRRDLSHVVLFIVKKLCNNLTLTSRQACRRTFETPYLIIYSTHRTAFDHKLSIHISVFRRPQFSFGFKKLSTHFRKEALFSFY